MKSLGKTAGLIAAAVVIALGAAALGASTSGAPTKVKTVRKGVEVVYISNFAQKFISDDEIRNDIPAWEQAINVDFAKYWHTTQYKLVFLGRKPAPPGHISAVFVNRGPIKGALAYHWTERGNAPSITVYAGTGVYYGFDNSVSFTHELEELAADPVTANLNVGYPADYYYEQKANGNIKIGYQIGVVGWFGEVSDPVEADNYVRPGADGKPVKISDFVTPAWFNDGVGGRYDFMGVCQQPFWIRPGGYAQFLDGGGWEILENWRKGHESDKGFFLKDPDPNESRS